MFDTQQLENLVREQVAQSVNNDIVSLLDNSEWLETVEQSIIEYAQQRVVARFSNADATQEILVAVKDSVKALFDAGQVSSIKKLVSEDDLKQVVKDELDSVIDRHITNLFGSQEWLNDIKQEAIAGVSRAIRKEFDANDIARRAMDHVESLFENYAKNIKFNGIDDRAEDTELSVMNGVVVVENELVARSMRVMQELTVGSITADQINTNWDELADNIGADVLNKFSNEIEDGLVERILDSAKAGIDFKSVSVNGSPLLEDGKLNKTIKETSITSVGTLKNLDVAGDVTLHNNTAVVVNKRVGINTQEPSMSLDVWDEEVQVSIGKKKERTAFIGSNRLQNLEIGVNGRGNITITDKNLVIIDQLQVGKNRITHGTDVPGYSGNKGDIVFNTNVGPNKPVFAWMCVGGFNWIALSATVS